jgi:methyl-accepting chemotaxis protein
LITKAEHDVANDWSAIRREITEFDAAAKTRLNELRPLFAKALPAIVEDFYRYVARHEPTIASLRDPQFIQQSIRLHLVHWDLIGAANFADEVGKSALDICHHHQKVGIAPIWYMGTRMLFLSTQLSKAVAASVAIPRYGRGIALAHDRRAALGSTFALAAALETEITTAGYFGSMRQIRKDAIANAKGRFGAMITTLTAASKDLTATAERLSSNTDKSTRLAGVVAGASTEASSNVQTVATATEELASSVQEISRQVADSSRVAGAAVEQANQTNARINSLSQAANRIGDVVKLITSVAEQTNLLALNATIEAARAGDAGRGFAVVAQEVKALASQTAKATDEIGTQIAGMQAATQEAVSSIKMIGTTIDQISAITAAITASIEEQGKATQDIAQNIQRAATGTSQVADTITEVSNSSIETGAVSGHLLASAKSLFDDTAKLESDIDGFLTSIAATA